METCSHHDSRRSRRAYLPVYGIYDPQDITRVVGGKFDRDLSRNAQFVFAG